MIRDKYETMNTAWPDVLPKITGQEAIAAIKLLYRFAGVKIGKRKWIITSGNRRTRSYFHEYHVNPDQGWRLIVHHVSHATNRRLNPTHEAHAPSHLQLERAMISFVVDQGWLDGRLRKSEKAKPDVREVRALRVAARLKSWEAKLKRAENAIKKLRRQSAYYERRAA